jgi:hypothetical protein
MRLQAVQMNKQSGEPWRVLDGDDLLVQLPGTMRDGEVINVIEFAQKIERDAYAEGVETGQGSMRAAQEQRITELVNRVTSLEAHNAMLASKLDEVIGGAES